MLSEVSFLSIFLVLSSVILDVDVWAKIELAGLKCTARFEESVVIRRLICRPVLIFGLCRARLMRLCSPPVEDDSISGAGDA